jgi:curved DNA-binding protein CbpA
MPDELDYYALLQVPHDADIATVRLAFRRLARMYHPDVAGSGSLAQMQRLNAAYRVLSDPALRRAYDEERGLVATSTTAPGQAPEAKKAPESRTGSIRHTSGPLGQSMTLPATDRIPVAALSFASGGALLGVGLLDGTIQVWDTVASRIIRTVSFNNSASDGILQEVRLSPNGWLAIAWGFHLGIRVFDLRTGDSLWHIGAYGPSGQVDAAVFDSPAWLRLALPDAPLTLSEEDPFRWAFEGRLGSGILSRPLSGPVDPSWAVPVRFPEVRPARRASLETPESRWRVQQRVLSGDGRALLTISAGRTATLPFARVFRVWEVDHRAARGGIEPQCISQSEQPAEYLQFPLAVTPDLRLACASFQDQELRIFPLGGQTYRSIATGPLGADAQIVFSADSRYVAVASGTHVTLFDVQRCRQAQEWYTQVPVTALAFVPRLQRALLAIALQNGLTELWTE